MSAERDSCTAMRERIHELFDGDDPFTLPADVVQHLEICPACAQMHADLARLRDLLRHAPAEPLPARTLDAVWAATTGTRRTRRYSYSVTRAAAAAVVATALIATTYFLTRPSPVGPSQEEILRAEAQADLVFGYTAKALAKTRDAAEDRVIVDKIVPAVRGGSQGVAPGKRG